MTTASNATAVQIIHFYAGGTTSMEHIDSARSDAELTTLKAEAARGMQGDQLELGLDLDATDIPTARGTGTEEQPWKVTVQRSGYLLHAIGIGRRRSDWTSPPEGTTCSRAW